MANLEDAVKLVESDADYIHCDCMDGHFVPNLTFGAPVVKAVKKISKLPLDVHLMIENPGRWIDDYLRAGLDGEDFLTIHVEAEEKALEVLKRIRTAGVRPGIAIKPKTPISTVDDTIVEADQILIMTVEPGFGGQSFMSEMLDKVRHLNEIGTRKFIIGIDGGIDISTAPLAVSSGADLLVAGSAIYGRDDPAAAIQELRKAIELQ